MNIVHTYIDALQSSARAVNAMQPLFALAARCYVGWQFLKSGWLKATSWENTIYLFREEYRVPLLPSDIAAVFGTTGELIFGTLVILGLAGRASAAGLFGVNLMAVVSYAHVLTAPGFEAALGQHYLWGVLLLVIVCYGPGSLSADGAIARATGPRYRGMGGFAYL